MIRLKKFQKLKDGQKCIYLEPGENIFVLNQPKPRRYLGAYLTKCTSCCHCHIEPNCIFNYCMKHKRHMSKRLAPEFRTNCYLRFVDYPSDIFMDARGIGRNNRFYSQEAVKDAMSIALGVPKEYLYGTKEDK